MTLSVTMNVSYLKESVSSVPNLASLYHAFSSVLLSNQEGCPKAVLPSESYGPPWLWINEEIYNPFNGSFY